MEANEKVKMLIKGDMEQDIDNYSIFNDNNYSTSPINKNKINSNNKIKKIILKSNGETNKSLNEEKNSIRNHGHDQSIILSQNIPIRMKSNSNYNNQFTLGNISRDSFKTSKHFLSGNKQPNLNRE